MDISVSGTIHQKMYLKKIRGWIQTLSPPGSAYDTLEQSCIIEWLHASNMFDSCNSK